jgi:DNA-binding transcriptional regulator LsrR (DeoR family)
MLTRVARMYHEEGLRAGYGLRDAVVVDAGAGDVMPALGAATAEYLDSTLSTGERIGIASWSATLMAAADAMQPTPATAGEVTQLVGIAPERLQAIPRRIGVAGGEQKYPAVRAALRGGWINVLITDTASAHRLAEERS